jgi:hypothetical protein
VQIYTFGRNDGPNNVATTVLPFLTSAAAFQTAYVPRFLVGGILPAPGETLSAFAAGNAQIAAGCRGALSIWAVPTAEEMAIIGFVPTAMVPIPTVARTRRIWPPGTSRPACARAQRPETATSPSQQLRVLALGAALLPRDRRPGLVADLPPSEETTPWSTLASILPFPLPEIRTPAALGRRRRCAARPRQPRPVRRHPFRRSAQRHPGGGRGHPQHRLEARKGRAGYATFTGRIDNGTAGNAGTVLTVTALAAGAIQLGQTITGAGVTATYITGQISERPAALASTASIPARMCLPRLSRQHRPPRRCCR